MGDCNSSNYWSIKVEKYSLSDVKIREISISQARVPRDRALGLLEYNEHSSNHRVIFRRSIESSCSFDISPSHRSGDSNDPAGHSETATPSFFLDNTHLGVDTKDNEPNHPAENRLPYHSHCILYTNYLLLERSIKRGLDHILGCKNPRNGLPYPLFCALIASFLPYSKFGLPDVFIPVQPFT